MISRGFLCTASSMGDGLLGEILGWGKVIATGWI